MIGTRRRLRIVGHGPATGIRLEGNWDERPLDGLRRGHGIERALDKVLRDQVRRARQEGCSWTEIGEALGTSKQAAWERFAGEE